MPNESTRATPPIQSRAERAGEVDRSGFFTAHEVELVDGIEYVSWYSNGLRVVDLSDPSQPTELGSFVPPATSDPHGHWVAPDGNRSFPLVWGVEVVGGLAFLSDVHSGLWIVRYAPPEQAAWMKAAKKASKKTGKKVMGIIRSTFVIDEDGVIEQAQYAVKAKGHVAKLARELAMARLNAFFARPHEEKRRLLRSHPWAVRSSRCTTRSVTPTCTPSVSCPTTPAPPRCRC